MKVAIIHYWLINLRGGEKVLESLCETFPQADIYTHVYNPDAFSQSIISKHKVTTTFINKLPRAQKAYQSYLPLMPMALEELDLNGYDLIISCESGPAKGIIPPPGVPHICYCHSPMRYAWDMYPQYKAKAGRLKRWLMPPLMHYLRRWDQQTSTQVSHFVANSHFIASRIQTYYRRDAEVIHPPVSFEEFELAESHQGYYLLLGQLVRYKRADIAVEAFNKTGKRLIVVGEGEQFDELKAIAGPSVELRGRLPFSEIKSLLAGCKALVFPGVEDFGIVPLEAMACGKPVIAYGKGGALETVQHGVTGLLFDEQNEQSLNNAINQFETDYAQFDCHTIRQHASGFGKDVFKRRFSTFVDRIFATKQQG
ncbi:glycosyltransferase family 4 protein [Pokkaliibacter sp. CJK22405]|uniref:glycosyltransferase family 4 protein n=1 Tax=Pokkaliibacter sp. CJK22405 TaxID=3384615 RepID=UPI00398479A8